LIRSIELLSAIHVNRYHSGSLLFHTGQVSVLDALNGATYFICVSAQFTLQRGSFMLHLHSDDERCLTRLKVW